MPFRGQVNNPTGANGWTGFIDEPQYGEITNREKLARGAPLAGGEVSAGPLNTPRRATRNAKRRPRPVQPPPPPVAVAPEPQPETMVPTAAVQDERAVWAEILATPGADEYPILAMLAGMLK